ncbi:DUF4376 domain-containing protein [Reyranella sp.]|uniref:DUF4376 domain-containing protein n=1 Tax=Reyranella sp. TaxID=1929291 RepID=UPI0027317AA2|nr:DUF4376 domain-containing protein [Reyranella sp.]MDP2373159.1 DUF4376 domain-containing protein [Reyranella sp.]
MPPLIIRHRDGTTETHPDPRPLADQQATALAELAERRRAALESIAWEGGRLAADDKSRQRLADQIEAMGAGQGSVNWRLADGVYLAMNRGQLQAARAAMQAHLRDCFEVEAGLAAQIMAAETAADLDALDLTAGWPG